MEYSLTKKSLFTANLLCEEEEQSAWSPSLSASESHAFHFLFHSVSQSFLPSVLIVPKAFLSQNDLPVGRNATKKLFGKPLSYLQKIACLRSLYLSLSKGQCEHESDCLLDSSYQSSFLVSVGKLFVLRPMEDLGVKGFCLDSLYATARNQA